jgi:DNA polymerase I-like protein with 3'-5' exonuclease and polymerase domains
MEWRRAQKLHSTYALSALTRVEEITHHGATGWVHQSIFQDATTGRLTTKNPNLTNQPKPEKGGKIIKGMYKCPDDYVFIFKDESQIELRVIAHVSNEPVWVEGFNKGYDMHAAMAHKVWHLPCTVEEVKDQFKPERSKAKAINFGIAFGESEFSLAERLGLTVEEASKLINEEYFGAAPVLKACIDQTHEFAKDYGYVSNIFGRRRHLPDAQLIIPGTAPWPKDDEKPSCYREIPGLDYLGIDEDDLYSKSDMDRKIVGILKAKKFSLASKCADCPFVRSCVINRHVKNVKGKVKRALRQSFNMVIQGSAADMVSLALSNITRELEENRIDSHPVLYIHDELGLYTHKSEVERVCRIMDYYMTEFLVEFTGFRVPLEVDTEIVQCWGDKK